MTGYYDLVLALIPVALLGIGGVLPLAGIPQPVAVSMAGVTAVGMIGHAIFVNAPVPSATSAGREDTQSHRNAGHAVQAD